MGRSATAKKKERERERERLSQRLYKNSIFLIYNAVSIYE